MLCKSASIDYFIISRHVFAIKQTNKQTNKQTKNQQQQKDHNLQ